jgi:Zn-dependent peptidase ImmA (M78 family)
MHEVAHIILGHPPRPPLTEDACRNYDPVLEIEANQLGFTLLIPKIAALYAVENFDSLTDAASYYGVSVSLLSHRIKISDAHRWALNRANKRRT